MSTSRLFIGESRLLFDGPLLELDWHQHSFACVLIGVDGEIEITGPSAQARKRARIVLAGPALSHRLEFAWTRVLSLYIPPHDPDFERLSHAHHVSLSTSWGPNWETALRIWMEREDASALADAVATDFGQDRGARMDHRVKRVVKRLWHGEGLRSGTRDMADWVGLSASRLSALLKQSTGSSLGQLQIAYRFWHSARAMLTVETFTEAAHAADFADAAHFSRSFKQSYGLPPSMIVLEKSAFARCETLG